MRKLRSKPKQLILKPLNGFFRFLAKPQYSVF